MTGGANARMINKYDYGLLEALKHARRSFRDHRSTLPDNPIVFASGVLTASFGFRSARGAPRRRGRARRVDGVVPSIRETDATRARRRRDPENTRARRGVAAMARAAPDAMAERTHAVTTKKHRRLPLAHGLQARAGFRPKLPVPAGS